ncbi:WXG100 family type VII secretion target [Nocardioides KLBMP 9356]|uniref:WXG100 family type VII secretion target n=1 Tax=Nocardioides potassii TaxID=2911371 RepID=A0ABS9H8M8_9ACTN|nr:WXG100 family type VII secretion target [Nocardioides potassii]MCF6376461.1 WXG100 family type VII secretion target [Nocardioides potassii]
MTYEVDLAELRATLAELAACQRDLVGIAGEIDRAQDRVRTAWTGRSADAHALTHEGWRDRCAEMVTALAGLRSIVTAADESYSRAVEANVAMWGQVSA